MAKRVFVVRIDGDLCKGCGLCVEFCPRGLIVLATELNKRGVQPAAYSGDPGPCTGCGNCAAMCPEAAIEIAEVTPDGPVKQPAKTTPKNKA